MDSDGLADGDGPSNGESQAKASFDKVMAQLRARVGTEAFQSWFARLQLEEASRSLVRLSVPTAFLRSWINGHYGTMIAELWQAEIPSVLKVEVVVRSATRAAPPLPANDEEPREAPRPIRRGPGQQGIFSVNRGAPSQPGRFLDGEAAGMVSGSPLDARYSFDNFVEGPSNRVALAAARSVAESAGGVVRFNPLFIHASVGLGKTHLLQAVARAAAENRRRVVYLTAEFFMWRFAAALRDNNALSFKESLRNIDVLVIDDMQFLQGKSIQYEFCHLLNSLLDSAKQVVVAADRRPSELESLDERVRSRLQGGVALDLGTPDYEMRLAILRQRMAIAVAEDPSVAIDDALLQHVAGKVTSSGRDLEGALNQLIFQMPYEKDMSVEKVDFLLSHLVRAGEPRKVRIEDIQKLVSRHYNVTRTDLLSDRRTRMIVKPRQVAMYLAKVLTPRSLPEIGHHFGGRDHTTVLHAVRKIERLAAEDSKLAQEIELLKRLISDQ